MNADRVIKSNMAFLNADMSTGGTYRRNTIPARGDNVEAAMDGKSVPGSLGRQGVAQTH